MQYVPFYFQGLTISTEIILPRESFQLFWSGFCVVGCTYLWYLFAVVVRSYECADWRGGRRQAGIGFSPIAIYLSPYHRICYVDLFRDKITEMQKSSEMKWWWSISVLFVNTVRCLGWWNQLSLVLLLLLHRKMSRQSTRSFIMSRSYTCFSKEEVS